MKELYIKEIEDYQDVIYVLREEFDRGYGLTEYDSVYQDILDYQEDKYYYWREKHFIEFIHYLERLTGLKSKVVK